MYDYFIEKLIAKAPRRRALDQGANLFRQGDRVRSVFVVEEGLVELVRRHPDGASIVLQRASHREVIAEASLYSDTYHCDAVARMQSSLVELPKTAFLTCLREDEEFSKLWAQHLAREVQSGRYQIEILSRKTVAERLDGWLAWRGDKMLSKGRWNNIATQIGVSPEALYRELAKRRSK